MDQNVQLTPEQLDELLKKVDDSESFAAFGVGPRVFEAFGVGPRVWEGEKA